MSKWSLLVGLVVLLLALATPAAAHGEATPAAGPAAGWLLALVYGQLVVLPFVGLFLIRQAHEAWFGTARQAQGEN